MGWEGLDLVAFYGLSASKRRKDSGCWGEGGVRSKELGNQSISDG